MSDRTMSAADSFRLANYIILLVLDDRRLNDYVKNPEARQEEMTAAGLTEQERCLLTTGCFENLCKYLEKARSTPAPDPATGVTG